MMAEQLGRLEQLVLFAVLRLDDDAYGVTIRREVEERTGRRLTAAAIYTTLRRLEARELLTSRIGEPTAERGGRRKKFYRLERDGLTALQQSWREVREMGAGLSAKLNRQLEEAEQ
jgi:DNA-binding PadR family transcriptional regulator